MKRIARLGERDPKIDKDQSTQRKRMGYLLYNGFASGMVV